MNCFANPWITHKLALKLHSFFVSLWLCPIFQFQKMEIETQKHVKYFLRHLETLPEHYLGLDTTRFSAIYFCVVGLDLLNHLHAITNKQDIIEFIYRFQIPHQSTSQDLPGSTAYSGCGGFLGTSASGQHFSSCFPCVDTSQYYRRSCTLQRYTCGHLAMTYTALNILLTLGDDLSRVDKKGIVEGQTTFRLNVISFAEDLVCRTEDTSKVKWSHSISSYWFIEN